MPAGAKIGAKAKQTRAAILEAAEVVFAEKSFARARLEDIASRVGIRRASLVYYFKDKPSLYGAVLDGLLGDLLARYQRVLSGTGPLPDRIERTIEEWARYAEERPALLRIMLREMADGLTAHSRPFAERAVPLINAIGNAIAAGQATRMFRAVNPLHFMMILAGSSAFLLLAGPLIAPTTAGQFPAAIDEMQQQHRQVLLSLTRSILGTRGPRAIREGDALGESK